MEVGWGVLNKSKIAIDFETDMVLVTVKIECVERGSERGPFWMMVIQMDNM